MAKQTKEMALERAKKDYEVKLLEIDKAFEIIEQIEPGLPEGWDVNYRVNLDISKYGKAPASEFREVCALVEAATDQTSGRAAGGDGSWQKLVAYLSVEIPPHNWLSINIGLYGIDDPDCKLIFTKETVVKVTAAPECLGIIPEE